MKTKIKTPTEAQKIFGKYYGNAAILNERPEGMPFEEYQRKRRNQTKVIKQVTR